MFTRISYSQFSLTWQISSVLHLAKARESYDGPGGFDRFLEDVRQAGLAAGYDYRDFDLDVVRHSGVPGFQGGNANLGRRGVRGFVRQHGFGEHGVQRRMAALLFRTVQVPR